MMGGLVADYNPYWGGTLLLWAYGISAKVMMSACLSELIPPIYAI